jgi:hypothetical protein
MSEENAHEGGRIKSALVGFGKTVNNPIAAAAEALLPGYNDLIVRYGKALQPFTDRLGPLGEVSQATFDPYRDHVAGRGKNGTGGPGL